jgi:hypothetical protein
MGEICTGIRTCFITSLRGVERKVEGVEERIKLI